MTFELFDPDGDVRKTRGALPHWFQPGVTYFVTFRAADSVPADLSKRWHREREDWLRRNGIDPTNRSWHSVLQGHVELDREYHRTFTRRFMDYLDRGLGECPLRRAEIAQIVAASLQYADDSKYHLGDFVVMPNHVHLLVCLREDTEVTSLCESWKHFTAHKINRALRRHGRFWQEDSFDHLVRSPEAFEHFRNYIAQNPIRANLRPGEYLLSSSLSL